MYGGVYAMHPLSLLWVEAGRQTYIVRLEGSRWVLAGSTRAWWIVDAGSASASGPP